MLTEIADDNPGLAQALADQDVSGPPLKTERLTGEAVLADEPRTQSLTDALRSAGVALDGNGFPVSWRDFDEDHHKGFLKKIVAFRGDYNVDVPDGLRGGEGQLFLSDLHPGRALKRHFPGRRGVARGVCNLEEALAALDSYPELQEYFQIVRIHDREAGLDWIERDFFPDSRPLSLAEKDTVVRGLRKKASESLREIVIVQGKSSLEILYSRFRQGRDNFHYLPLERKFLWIDGQ